MFQSYCYATTMKKSIIKAGKSPMEPLGMLDTGWWAAMEPLQVRRILDAMLLELGTQQLTHELLSTLMSEVAEIVNAQPITAIPSNVDEPQPLTPAMLLTQKSRPIGPLPGSITAQDLYARPRWRRIQYLADQFWTRWRREYVHNLQARSKWNQECWNLTAFGPAPIHWGTREQAWIDFGVPTQWTVLPANRQSNWPSFAAD